MGIDELDSARRNREQVRRMTVRTPEIIQPATGITTKTPVGTPLHTVLCIDRDAANLMLMQEIFALRPEILFLAATHGNQGIEIARAVIPDVILMEVLLPDINGFEATNILKQDSITAHIPVIAISSNAFPKDIEKGLAVGFFRYLTKPFKLTEFMQTMDMALNSEENNRLGPDMSQHGGDISSPVQTPAQSGYPRDARACPANYTQIFSFRRARAKRLTFGLAVTLASRTPS
jgi:CheY-like chemotaxis protein